MVSSSNSKGTNAPVGNVNKSGNNTQIGDQPTPQQAANNAKANAISLASANNRNNDKASTVSGTFNPKAGEVLSAPKPAGPTTTDAGLIGSSPDQSRKGYAPNVPKGGFFDPTKTTPKNAGSGYGAGRVSFDKSGNTKTDNLITSFAGQQAKETFLSNQGLGNNGTIINEGKFAVADFSGIARYNISGVRGNPNDPALAAFVGPLRAKEQESNPIFEMQQAQRGGKDFGTPKEVSQSGLSLLGKSGNAGQGALLSGDQIYRGSAKEDQAKQKEADKASSFYSSGSQYGGDNVFLKGGKDYPVKQNPDWVPPLGNGYKNMGQGINGSELNKGTAKEQSAKLESAKTSEASRASNAFIPKGYGDEYGSNPVFTIGGTKYPVHSESYIVSLGNAKKGIGKPVNGGYGNDFVNAKLGTTQLYRGTSQEEAAKGSASNNSSLKSGYLTGGGLYGPPTASKARSTPPATEVKSVLLPTSPSNQQSSSVKTIATLDINEGIGLDEGLSGSYKGQSVIKQNSQNQSFDALVTSWQKEGDTINVFANDKKVGSFSGPNALTDIYKLNDKYPNGVEARADYATTPQGKAQLAQASKGASIVFANTKGTDKAGNPIFGDYLGTLSKNNASPEKLDLIVGNSKSFGELSKVYPEEEKAIMGSISKNPAFFENQPKEYYQGLGNRSKLQPNDIDVINGIFRSYDKSQNRKYESELKQSYKPTYDVIQRKDPSYNFNILDENNNPVSVRTPKSERVNPEGTATTLGGTKIGTTSKGSFYDYYQVNKLSPTPAGFEPHFSNRFGYEDITGIPTAITGGKAKLSPNAQRGGTIVDKLFNGPDEQWWISPEKTSLPTKGEIPSGVSNQKEASRVSALSTSSLIGSKTGIDYSKVNTPLHGGLSAIADSIVGGVGYGVGLSESIGVHLQPEKTSLPTKGEIPSGLVNSTQKVTPRNNDLTTSLLSGGKTDVQYSKIQNKSNAGYDIYHTIIPFSTYLVHDTGTLLINAGKQINSVNYFVKNSEVKNPNFAKPTFNIGELHAANPNLTPEATRLVNKTSSPNPYSVIMGKEPLQKVYTGDYYAVKAVIPFLGLETGLTGVGGVLKPIGSAVKTKVGQLSREAAINYGSPIVSRPSPRFGESTGVVRRENPVIVVFNNKVAKPVKTKASDLVSPVIRVSSFTATDSGFGQRGKIPLGGSVKERYNVPVDKSNIYGTSLPKQIKSEQDKAITPSEESTVQGPVGYGVQTITDKKTGEKNVTPYEFPAWEPRKVSSPPTGFNRVPVGGQNAGLITFGTANPGGPNKVFASGKAPVKNDIITSDTNRAYTARGRQTGMWSPVSAGQITSEYFEKTAPSARNEWYTSEGKVTDYRYNTEGFGIFKKSETKRKKTTSNEVPFLSRGKSGKLLFGYNKQTAAEGRPPVRTGKLEVSIPFGNKSSVPRYVSKSDILAGGKTLKSKVVGEDVKPKNNGMIGTYFMNEKGQRVSKVRASSEYDDATRSLKEFEVLIGKRSKSQGTSDLGKDSSIFGGGHVKNSYSFGGKGATNPAFSNRDLINNPPQSRIESIQTKYTTSSDRLGYSVNPSGKPQKYRNAHDLSSYAKNEKLRNQIFFGGKFKETKLSNTPKNPRTYGARERAFTALDVNLAPRGKTEIYGQSNKPTYKESKNYSNTKSIWNPTVSGSKKGSLATGRPPLKRESVLEEFTSNAKSPEELALSNRYPKGKNYAYSPNLDSRVNSFFSHTDNLQGRTKFGDFFNRNDRVQKSINGRNKTTKELTGSSSPIRSFWQPKTTKEPRGFQQSKTHRSFGSAKSPVTEKTDIMSNKGKKSVGQIDIGYNPKNLSLYSKLSSVSRKPKEREYKFNLEFGLGKFSKTKNKRVKISLFEKKPYTTKNKRKLNEDVLYGGGHTPKDLVFGEAKTRLEDNRERAFGKERVASIISKNQQKGQTGKGVIEYNKKYNKKSQFVSDTHGTLSEAANNLDTGGYSAGYIGGNKYAEVKADYNNSHNIGNSGMAPLIQEAKQSSQQKPEQPKPEPKVPYGFTNPESNPSKGYGSFYFPQSPSRPSKTVKNRSRSSLGLLAGTTGILGQSSSISSQYGQMNKSIQGINFKSGQASRQSSILDNMTKIATKSGQRQSPKQSSLYKQTSEQTSKSGQIFDQAQVQGSRQSSKQASGSMQAFISVSQPKLSSLQISKQFQIQPQKLTTTNQPPPKKIIIPPFGGNKRNKGKGKRGSGPTALFNLGVKNVFSSSLNITVKKGQRYEF